MRAQRDAVRFHLTNHQFSTAALDFGELSDSDIGNTIGYAGYRFNAETGHYAVRFRVYSPTLGRFIQTDPAGYVDGMNLSGYVTNSPIANTDAFGLLTGGRTLQEYPELFDIRGVKAVADELAKSAKETLAAMKQAGKVLAAIALEVGLMAVTGPAGRVIGFLVKRGGQYVFRAIAHGGAVSTPLQGLRSHG